MIERLRAVIQGVDAEMLTAERFLAALKDWKAHHPDEVKKEADVSKDQKIMEQLVVPKAEVAEVVMAEEVEKINEVETRQRQRLKPYSKGDVVEIWSAKHGAWMLDGEV